MRWLAAPRLTGGARSPELAAKRLLVVGTGGPKRLPVFARLRALGLGRIVCLAAAPNWAAPFVDEWIGGDAERADGDGEAAVMAWLAAGGRLDGVLTFDEYGVELAAALAERLGLPGVGRTAAAAARDKRAFRAACAAAGIAAPLVHPLSGRPDEALARLRAAGARYPLVVKPAYGAGSHFVTRVDDEGELLAALKRLRAAPTRELDRPWTAREIFAERYLDGPEVDVDVLVQAGAVRWAAVSDNAPPHEPWFVEVGGRTPSGLPAAAIAALRELAAAVVAALGVRDGCLHLEARVTSDGPVPLEANLRLGGAEVRAFQLAAFDLDPVDQAVRAALGLPLNLPEPSAVRAHAASLNFVPVRGGRLAAVEIAPDLAARPGFVELMVFRAPGDVLRVPPEGFDYMGWLVAEGRDAAEAERHLQALAAGVRFDIG